MTKNSCYNTFSNSILECSHITDEVIKNQCYACIAVYNNNSDLCESINGTKDICHREFGVYSKDLSVCEKAGTLKDVCISDVSVTNGNSTLCSKVANNEMKNRCYHYSALFNYDPEICSMIQQDNAMRDTCYYNVAINSNNTEGCKNIKNSEVRTVCSKLIDLINENKI